MTLIIKRLPDRRISIRFSKICVEIENGCRYNEKVAWAVNHCLEEAHE